MVRQEEGFALRACLEAGKSWPRQDPGQERPVHSCQPDLLPFAVCITLKYFLNFQPCVQARKCCHSHVSHRPAIHATIARSYLDLEVMLDELCCILARIWFLCSVIAICLIAIVFCEGFRFLTSIWDTALLFVALLP